ncbi:MAG: hypothetical protein HZB85_10190 [Deltaproteobacteria bacterium]|nr:hypothetical protein [Deltaproteobacteria bacterium]
MFKRLFITAFVVPAVMQAGYAAAEQGAAQPGMHSIAETPMTSELEAIIKTNELFITTARKAVDKTGTAEAKSLLSRAEAARINGYGHFTASETRPAIDDYSESTHLAVQIIVLVKNEQGMAAQTPAIETAEIIKAGDDRERKEAMIKKGLAEVEAFIKTAERLQGEGESTDAAMRLTEARSLYEASKNEFSDGRYDKALDDVNRAYMAATGAVRVIKKERAEIITFPRPASTDAKDVLSSELKKNDAYRYFASQVIPDGNRKIAAYMKQGDSLRDEAAYVMNGGDASAAIGKLKESTELYIEAIKQSIQ